LPDAAFDVGKHFGMHQRHVQKLLFLCRQICVPPKQDGIFRKRQRRRVLRKRACIIAEEIAAELIEDDDGGKQRPRCCGPVVRYRAGKLGMELAETARNSGIHGVVMGKPLLGREFVKPEG
jgi:hypothetical protein